MPYVSIWGYNDLKPDLPDLYTKIHIIIIVEQVTIKFSDTVYNISLANQTTAHCV
jgi:hypothetical protein